MKYALKCSPLDNYILIRIEGTWTPENGQDIINDIYNLTVKHNSLPLLLDILDMESDPSVMTDYDDVQGFVDTGFRFIDHIAVLDNIIHKDNNDFFENAAYNRGITIRFFYSGKEEALKWLLSRGKSL